MANKFGFFAEGHETKGAKTLSVQNFAWDDPAPLSGEWSMKKHQINISSV